MHSRECNVLVQRKTKSNNVCFKVRVFGCNTVDSHHIVKRVSGRKELCLFQITLFDTDKNPNNYLQVADYIRDQSRDENRPEMCPEWLYTLTVKCRHPDPAQRPNAKEVTDALKKHWTSDAMYTPFM